MQINNSDDLRDYILIKLYTNEDPKDSLEELNITVNKYEGVYMVNILTENGEYLPTLVPVKNLRFEKENNKNMLKCETTFLTLNDTALTLLSFKYNNGLIPNKVLNNLTKDKHMIVFNNDDESRQALEKFVKERKSFIQQTQGHTPVLETERRKS